jgi:LemA protein
VLQKSRKTDCPAAFFLGETMIGLIVVVILIFILVLVFWTIGARKRLGQLRQLSSKAFIQIDLNFKQRHDLILQLLEAAQAYLPPEHPVLLVVLIARNQGLNMAAKAVADLSDTSKYQDLATAESALEAALADLFDLFASYPDLQADRQVQHLTEALAERRKKMAFVRLDYNEKAHAYNSAIMLFPVSLLAMLLGFKAVSLLQIVAVAIEQKAAAPLPDSGRKTGTKPASLKQESSSKATYG